MDAAIERTRAFFEAMGVATRLSDYGLTKEVIPVIAARFEKRGWTGLGERQDVGPAMVEAILAYSV